MPPFEAFLDPEKAGYKVCSRCNGYGSSFKDPPGVNRCTCCGGYGLKKIEPPSKPKQPKQAR